MSKANTKYRLLTTAIVSALHINQPQPRGTVWEGAEGSSEAQEGDALVAVGFAEITNEAVTKKDELADTDTPLLALLEGSVAEVTAALEGLDASQLKRLAKLEAKGAKRKGVADAIAEYDLGE